MSTTNQFRQSQRVGDLQDALGSEGWAFLQHALSSLTRLLPHTETTRWSVASSDLATKVKWQDSNRRTIAIRVQIAGELRSFIVEAKLSRKTAASGVGHIARTLDVREFDLCRLIADRITAVLRSDSSEVSEESLRAIRSSFDEQIVAAHLRSHHSITIDIGRIFAELRRLAEQSYENKSITYGLLIQPDGAGPGAVFPTDFFDKKRYRALSDGFRTAFEVTSDGKLLGLCDLRDLGATRDQRHFYPEWCDDIAESAKDGACGIALTRQGDLLIFDSGNLRFTYRAGRWQYWNHRHVCDLFRNRARVQRVPTNVLPRVVKSIYRAALDVSFRRSGALFVLLRNKNNRKKLVISGDAIGDPNREAAHLAFDGTLGQPIVQTMPRVLLAELAGLDGGVVLDNHGHLLAYGAVLKTSGRFSPSEGSRTKAAISASRYGIAVKVSSDGEIAFYEDGKVFLEL